ncbi:tRNA pseudouridine synthase A [Oribacterium sp. P6A1]|uniref:tRNA pseudouridine synthase A n=1 Tax=Oribacterium sp. P6A1 TaxID=1410612 RepID=UPI0005625671|nr:tRNA pseudouridine synthase A [Oribacterium sp. P6A1]
MNRRIKLTISYDGSNYKGWQIQNPTEEKPEGDRPTVQGMLTLAIRNLIKGEEIQLIGASRTDSGVHAKGNVAVFDTESSIPAENFPFAINSFLPDDIRVMKAEEVDLDFNPRFVPHKKTYEYKVDNSLIQLPVNRLYTYNFTYGLDLKKMKKAADYLVGEHDFTSFVNPDSQVFEHGGDAVREIYSVEILGQKESTVDNYGTDEKSENTELGHKNTSVSRRVKTSEEQLITIRISGNGFLYHMIRIIVGTLLQVGNGKREPEEIKDILEARDRTKAGPTVPAKGLCLVELNYP